MIDWPTYRSSYLAGIVSVFRRRTKALSTHGEFLAYTDEQDQRDLNREYIVMEHFPSTVAELRMTVWDDGELALDIERTTRRSFGEKLFSYSAMPARMINAPKLLTLFEDLSQIVPFDWPSPDDARQLRNSFLARIERDMGRVVED